MKGISILFPGARGEEEKERYPQYLKDCNLDQIVREICEKNRKLEPYFLRRLQTEEEVLFRQHVFQDLESEELAAAVKEFIRREHKRKKRQEQAKELRCATQIEWYTLDRICYGIKSILRFYEKLVPMTFCSEGFQTLRRYLKEKVTCERFQRMKQQGEELVARLSEMDYTIKIKWSTVEVAACDQREDYSKKVEKTFLRFRQEDAKPYFFRGKEPDLVMNEVEERILKGVVKLYPETFEKMTQFVKQYQTEKDEILEQFCEEVPFYLAYLDYIKPIKKSGLSFCYPEITDRETGECRDGFDLGLASKRQGVDVTTNDFSWGDQETVFLVTGANQGGKTTYARMTGQAFHLTALGVPIPGRRACLFLCDAIFTHFEREEAIRTENGKLRDDLERMKMILEHATEKSFLIMNETFSSATLQDALFLGTEIVRKVLDRGTLCLFVTFLNELEKIDERIVGLVSVVDEQKNRTHKICRTSLSGNADAKTIAEKYRLSYEQIKERLQNESISIVS